MWQCIDKPGFWFFTAQPMGRLRFGVHEQSYPLHYSPPQKKLQNNCHTMAIAVLKAAAGYVQFSCYEREWTMPKTTDLVRLKSATDNSAPPPPQTKLLLLEHCSELLQIIIHFTHKAQCHSDVKLEYFQHLASLPHATTAQGNQPLLSGILVIFDIFFLTLVRGKGKTSEASTDLYVQQQHGAASKKYNRCYQCTSFVGGHG